MVRKLAAPGAGFALDVQTASRPSAVRTAGYLEKNPLPDNINVEVLTPEPIVRCLRNGYKPEIHASLQDLVT
jgi:hypothetical protein